MNYTTGLLTSLLLMPPAIVGGVIALHRLTRQHARPLTRRFLRSHVEGSRAWHLYVSSTFIAASAWPAIYCVTNFISQLYHHTFDLKYELQTGVIGLRIASLLLGYRSIHVALRSFVPFSRRYLYDVGLASETLPDSTAKLSPYRLGRLICTQYFLYLIPICLLWACAIKGVSTLPIVALNWALFFIVDDWNIIADNLVLMRGDIIRKHYWRVSVANMVIGGLFLYACYEFGGAFDSKAPQKELWVMLGGAYGCLIVLFTPFWQKIHRLPALPRVSHVLSSNQPHKSGTRTGLG